ncbi:MAG: formylglycine-generating enzyme family protein [Candidatus Cloacimonetes bacterium]|nr:formylglycine-generating enzyme family protein [Candidatus Cloacimonadota bacterium]
MNESFSGKDMVLVEGGTFKMGSEMGKPRDWAIPVHTVSVESFYIGKFLVTQKDWLEVMGSSDNIFFGNDYPEVFIQWYQAIEFCNELSKKEGLGCVYNIRKVYSHSNDLDGYGIMRTSVDVNPNCNGYRLPTEAEWEFAARGGNKSRGYIYSGSNNLEKVGWCINKDIDKKKMHRVGEKNPNELGIYDMSGFYWEWCWDKFARYPTGSKKDPDGVISGSKRVLRGGTMNHEASWCTVFFRWSSLPDDILPVGIRLCRNFS